MNVSKLLVVDKSVFHTLHCCDEKLFAFTRNYNVVLPDALTRECLISEKQIGTNDKDPEKLLRSFQGAIKAGAKMGCSLSKLFQDEKCTLCPVKSVVNEGNTKLFRNDVLNTEDIKQEAKRCRKLSEPIIGTVRGIAGKMYENRCKNPKSAKKHSEQNTTDRYRAWIQKVDPLMKNILGKEFSKQICSHADASWFTWQITRLWFAYIHEWVFKKVTPGFSVKKDISNDLYDIEYVAYLSRADGLLTNDQKSQVPLTEAAFPQKDLFVVDTRLNDSRNVQDVFDEIVSKIPAYKIE